MMLLEQESYPDEDGGTLRADEIEAVGTFKYAADGFFEWECPHCRKRANTRAFTISGVVFTCHECNKQALLLRSDTRFVTGIVSDYNKRGPREERAVQNALQHIGEAVTCLSKR